MRPRSLLLLAPLVALAAGCAPAGKYVWVDQYQATAKPVNPQYVVTPGDLISVRVYGQEAMSARVRVRADGRISLPLLGEIEAAGLSPAELSGWLQVRMKEFVVNPAVTVSLEEPRHLEIYVVGEVTRPGRLQLEPKSTVLQALAAAGGLTPFASNDRVFVIRRFPALVRIRFPMDSLKHSVGESATFRLIGGDTIVVE